MSRYVLYEKRLHIPVSFIDYTDNTDIKLYMVTGVNAIDTGISSYDFIADIYAKWDSCTHWWFLGEDHDDGETKDAYYHICGPDCLRNMFLCMVFAWEICKRINMDRCDDKDPQLASMIDSEYKDSDKINKMIDHMLDEYIIEETEITPIPNIKI